MVVDKTKIAVDSVNWKPMYCMAKFIRQKLSDEEAFILFLKYWFFFFRLI